MNFHAINRSREKYFLILKQRQNFKLNLKRYFNALRYNLFVASFLLGPELCLRELNFFPHPFLLKNINFYAHQEYKTELIWTVLYSALNSFYVD